MQLALACSGGRPGWPAPGPLPEPHGDVPAVRSRLGWRGLRGKGRMQLSAALTGMRDKPRRSGRGRIAARLAQRAVSDDAATRKLSRTRPTPGQGESNACGDTSSAARHSAQEPTVPAAQAAQSESPGLQAGEDVNEPGGTTGRSSSQRRFGLPSAVPPSRRRHGPTAAVSAARGGHR